MYIAIYVCAIVLVVVLIVLFFVLRNKKDKRHLNDYKNSGIENVDRIMKEVDFHQSIEKEQNTDQVEIVNKEPVIDAEFEDFSLDEKKSKVSKQEVSAADNNTFFNPFVDETDDFEDDEDNGDDNFDEKFAEYEKFLRESLRYDSEEDELKNVTNRENSGNNDVEEELEGNDALNALTDFDFDSLKGKSDDEIAELIKSLPPKAQELLMTDILGKKNFDDKED